MPNTAEDEILERAGLTQYEEKPDGTRRLVVDGRDLIKDMRMVSRIVDGAARAWEVNQSAPGSSAQKVQSIFRADEDGAPGDARVYVIPTDDSGMFACYTVNRHDAGSLREFLSGEAFMEEVAAEMTALAVAKGILEECPDEDCGGVNPTDAVECATCGQKLGDEEEPEVVAGNGQAPDVEGQRATTPVPRPPPLTVDESEFMKP
jgi:hypothetical protein